MWDDQLHYPVGLRLYDIGFWFGWWTITARLVTMGGDKMYCLTRDKDNADRWMAESTLANNDPDYDRETKRWKNEKYKKAEIHGQG